MSNETNPQVLEDLRSSVQKLLSKKGITKFELKIEGKTTKGDNYMGDVIFFKVITEDNGEVYSLAMKTVKRSEKLRKVIPTEMAFNREIFMYSVVFPTFRDFIKEVNSKFEIDFLAKLYWIETEAKKETLIFENLKSRGYKLHSRDKPWSLEHSLLAMRKYGKFHGVSLAMRDQRPELFEDLTKNLTNVYAEFRKNSNLAQVYGPPINNAMELLRRAGRGDLISRFDGLLEECGRIATGHAEDKDRIVIAHGDCWNSNYMFKYQENNVLEPSDICFLDFQLSMVDTPIRDLSYNIYTTCDKTCLDHFDLLLETYYSSLSNTVKSLGSNPDELFTYEQLRQQWKQYGKFGLLTACLIIKIELINEDDCPDIVQLVEEGKSFTSGFMCELKNRDEYDRRVLEVFTHFGDWTA